MAPFVGYSANDFAVRPGESIVASTDRLLVHLDDLIEPAPSSPVEVLHDLAHEDPERHRRATTAVLTRPHRRA